MFISTDHLAINYGVDDKIARFFVDREPPVNNLYWKGKLLYLRPAVGYLFIPLIVDLLYKSGIDRQQLLSEQFVTTMEQIGHISALEETKQISQKEAIEQCATLVETITINKEWFTKLKAYFSNLETSEFRSKASAFKALHRGDVFLFSLNLLDFPEALFVKIIEQWFALITTLLLLDDAEDIKIDKEAGEENAFLESGLNADGLDKIRELVKQNLHTINSVNPSLSRTLQGQYNVKVEKVIIQPLLSK